MQSANLGLKAPPKRPNKHRKCRQNKPVTSGRNQTDCGAIIHHDEPQKHGSQDTQDQSPKTDIAHEQ
jgi:hypothetical protein